MKKGSTFVNPWLLKFCGSFFLISCQNSGAGIQGVDEVRNLKVPFAYDDCGRIDPRGTSENTMKMITDVMDKCKNNGSNKCGPSYCNINSEGENLTTGSIQAKFELSSSSSGAAVTLGSLTYVPFAGTESSTKICSSPLANGVLFGAILEHTFGYSLDANSKQKKCIMKDAQQRQQATQVEPRESGDFPRTAPGSALGTLTPAVYDPEALKAELTSEQTGLSWKALIGTSEYALMIPCQRKALRDTQTALLSVLKKTCQQYFSDKCSAEAPCFMETIEQQQTTGAAFNFKLERKNDPLTGTSNTASVAYGQVEVASKQNEGTDNQVTLVWRNTAGTHTTRRFGGRPCARAEDTEVAQEHARFLVSQRTHFQYGQWCKQ